MKPILETCIPRPEVLKSDLEDALFAADFSHVIQGIAPRVYQDPAEFFRNTYPTTLLKKVVSTIFQRLADPGEAGAAVRLSTGFGGGKTHTLIALWHLARNVGQPALGTELLPAAGRPPEVAVAGIDARAFGAVVCGRHGDLETHSLWGELAYQLGGREAYERVRDLDSPTTVPDAGLVRDLLPDKPTLILLDELVIYMAILSEQAQKAILSFLGTLIAEVSARRQAVVVITDPAGQPVYERQTASLADVARQAQAAQHLDDVLGRRVSDYDPIGGETAEVIVRRLFEHVDQEAAHEVSAEYYKTYQRIAEEHPGALPPEAATPDYAQSIVRSYPFHPRLLETAQGRLGALQDFNKSRGTLRLFARILRDVWESQRELYLITAGDLDWTSDRIQADLLQRLNRDRFKAAVEADVVKHAGQLDADYGTDIHRRVASALLLESIPLSPTAGMDRKELALAVLRPSDVGIEPGEAMDRLMAVCWHTYRDETGTRFQFRYEPNANKIIEERAESDVTYEDGRQAVLLLAQDYFGGHTFSLVAYPSSPRAVADEAALQLVLADSEELAQAVCDYKDDSDPQAKYERRFRNSILGIAPTPSLLEDAIRAMRRFLAAKQIQKEEQHKAKGKRKSPLLEEVERLLPELRRRARVQTYRAFNRVVFSGKPSVTLDEKYLVSRESPLEGVSGQAKLKEFLDDRQWVYQPNDALDVDLLLEKIMPGATPSLEHKGAFPASAVHERALAYPGLRLMPNEAPVRNAILKAVEEGRLVVRLPSGEAYDHEGCVVGPPEARRRDPNRRLRTLKLTHDVLLAPPDAPCVEEWLRVEKPSDEELLSVAEAAERKGVASERVEQAIDLGELDVQFEGGEPLVVANARFWSWRPEWGVGPPVASCWEKAMDLASTRPLVSLRLVTTNPAAAPRLIAVAQPFGARSLSLMVQASGRLKGGGQVNFLAQDVPHNHSLKPIDLAKRLLRSAEPDTAQFRAELHLGFGPQGRTGMVGPFETARAQAGQEITLEARFGEEPPHA